MKRILTKWQLWAALFAVAVAVIVVFVPIGEEEVPRRDYMTLEEYNNVDIGMTLDEFTKVQDAKPAKDTVPIGENLFETVYSNKSGDPVVHIYIAEQDDGTKVIEDKSIIGELK
jgi:hypothetical protein